MIENGQKYDIETRAVSEVWQIIPPLSFDKNV